MKTSNMIGSSEIQNFPPMREDIRDFESLAKPSERVLVQVENGKEFWFGRYFHGLNEWSVDGWTGSPKVTKWWKLPDPDSTGNG